jgi:hypothetical protein
VREGVAGLLREKTRKPGVPPLPPAVVERVVALTWRLQRGVGLSGISCAAGRFN